MLLVPASRLWQSEQRDHHRTRIAMCASCIAWAIETLVIEPRQVGPAARHMVDRGGIWAATVGNLRLGTTGHDHSDQGAERAHGE